MNYDIHSNNSAMQNVKMAKRQAGNLFFKPWNNVVIPVVSRNESIFMISKNFFHLLLKLTMYSMAKKLGNFESKYIHIDYWLHLTCRSHYFYLQHSYSPFSHPPIMLFICVLLATKHAVLRTHCVQFLPG